jgi:methyl-accepting chemotaxis protein
VAAGPARASRRLIISLKNLDPGKAKLTFRADARRAATGRYATPTESIALFNRRNGLGLQGRFMLITGAGLLAVVACVIALVGWFETGRLEGTLRAASESELLSLNALVSSAMEQRAADKEEVAITVFNRWFEHRNVDYPGKLWSVWSPQMSAFMANAAANRIGGFNGDAATTKAAMTKPPRDPIDEEVLRTGRPVGRFVEGTYRYSLPIILGVTAGTDQKVCRDCHGPAMNQKDGEVIAVFSSSLSTEAGFAALRRLLTWMAGAALAGTLILLLIIHQIFDRVISRRLAVMTRIMRCLADGDRTIDVPARNRSDEIGDMARAIEVFRHHAIEKEQAAEREEQHNKAVADTSAALRDMAETIENETNVALREIGTHTTAMAATAGSMDASATRTGAAAQSAADAADQAVVNAQTVAGAAEHLTASIREISGQVGQSSAVVRRAVAAGGDARATIEALNGKVERIGVVAEMIGDIAAKTNLLALNATIEAARAGEAGRGFAVVASEVKQLAAQTARSTEEIGRHLNEVRTATGASVAAVGAIERTISEMDSIAGSIAAAVEEQGAATAEIARNVAQTADAANEITSRIAEVSAEARETGEHAADVQIDAAGLAELVSALRSTVVRIIRTSTAEVDRRHGPRVDVNMPCWLTVAGMGAMTGRVTDLSEGGAKVETAAVLAPGTRGTLSLDGIRIGLPFIVSGMRDRVLGLAFELDDAGTAAVRAALNRAPPRAA